MGNGTEASAVSKRRRGRRKTLRWVQRVTLDLDVVHRQYPKLPASDLVASIYSAVLAESQDLRLVGS